MTMTLNTATTSARAALNDYLTDLDHDEIAIANWETEQERIREKEATDRLASYLCSLDRNSAEYWDVYKEVYGIRPRW